MATLDAIYTLLLSNQKDLKNINKQIRKINTRFDDPDGSKAAERAKNNGFNRVQSITPALADFLGIPRDEKLSRSTVTRQVNVYIKENNLKHPENGRVIMIEKDTKLATLLQVPEGEQLTYLNIQRYLSPHYVKDVPVTEDTAEPPVAVDPEDLNGDGRVTRSEATEYATEQTKTASPAATPKKKPVITKKKPVIRKPISTSVEA